MTQLPDKAIEEFRVLWQKHFGEELPKGEATIRAHQVFGLVKLLAQSLERQEKQQELDDN